MKRKALLLLSVMIVMVLSLSMVLTACGGEHEHEFATEWTKTATEHYHKAICEHSDEKADVGTHSFQDGACSVCGYPDPNYNPNPGPGPGPGPDPVEEKKATIHFAGLGEIATEEVEVTVGVAVDLTKYVATREGWDFDGWMDDDDKLVTSFTPAEEGATYYFTSTWTALVSYSYKIVLTVDGVEPEIAKLVDGEARVDVGIVLPTLTSADYDSDSLDFIGYYIDDEEVTGTVDLSEYSEPAEIEIEARFGVAYIVSFDLNYDQAPAVASQKIIAGESATIVVPERIGFRFLGWYSAAEDGQQLVGASATSYVPSASVTLYAHWAEIMTVTFEYGNPYNSQEMRTAAVSGIDGETTTLVTPAFPTGTSSATHIFLGWCDNIDGEVDDEFIYKAGTRYNIHNVTLYAIFDEIPQIIVRWEVEGQYMPDNYNVTVTEGSYLEANQIPTATQVAQAFDGYTHLRWLVYRDAEDLHGEELGARTDSDGTVGGTVISAASLRVSRENGKTYLNVHSDGFNAADMKAYRFEAETHAIITGVSSANSGTWFETATAASGGITACGMSYYSASQRGLDTMTYNLYAASDVSVKIAIAVSPGYQQGGAAVVDGTDYKIFVNGERVNFATYNLPPLINNNWNGQWGTAWVDVDLKQGANAIVFDHTGLTSKMANIDYLEVISPVEVRAIGEEVTFVLGDDATFGAQQEITNDQGVSVVLDTTPHGTTLYLPLGTEFLSAAAGRDITVTMINRIPEPVRAGYTFAGWKVGSTSGANLAGQTVTAGMTIYATWTPAS